MTGEATEEKSVTARNAHQEAAQRAAADGDAMEMLEELAASGYLEELEFTISYQFDRLDEEAARWVVAQAVDSLAERIRRGERKRDIFPYLLKAAKNLATDQSKALAAEIPLDAALLGKLSRGGDGRLESPEPIDDEERERIDQQAEDLRRAQLHEVRRLIPRIPQARPRQVMGYIFDALETGAQEVTNAEISAALGITKDNVKAAKSRGFGYLVDRAQEAGLLSPDFKLFEKKLVALDDLEGDEQEYEYEAESMASYEEEEI